MYASIMKNHMDKNMEITWTHCLARVRVACKYPASKYIVYRDYSLQQLLGCC